MSTHTSSSRSRKISPKGMTAAITAKSSHWLILCFPRAETVHLRKDVVRHLAAAHVAGVGEGIGHHNTEPLATTLTVLSIRVNQQPTARGSVEWPPERGRNSKRVRKNWVIDASSGVNNLVSGVAGRPPGSRKFWDGDRGRRPEVPAARPGRPRIHRGHAKRRTAERSRRVAGCKGRPREPAARLSGDHRPGRFRSIGQDGANTRDEAWRGRFWRRAGKAWPC